MGFTFSELKKYKGISLLEEMGIDITEIKEAILEVREHTPSEMREKIENEEWMMEENFQKQEDESYVDQKGHSASDGLKAAVNRRIKLRMLSESPYMRKELGD
jgi:predicted Co/Zn/Cd cation transporter (cation efflux family)